MSTLFVKKKNEKYEPEYQKGWREANSQFSVVDGKLLIDYEDDDEPGLTDVSSLYDWEWRE